MDGDLGGGFLDVDGDFRWICVGFGGFWVVPVNLVAVGPVAGVRGASALFAGRVRLRPWFLARMASTASAWAKWGLPSGRAFSKQWHGGAGLILGQCLQRVHQSWCLL